MTSRPFYKAGIRTTSKLGPGQGRQVFYVEAIVGSEFSDKLVALLDDRDALASKLEQAQSDLQSRSNDLSAANSQLAALQKQIGVLHDTANAALLSTQNPDDVKLQQRVDTAYAAMNKTPEAPAPTPNTSSPFNSTPIAKPPAPKPTIIPVTTQPAPKLFTIGGK